MELSSGDVMVNNYSSSEREVRDGLKTVESRRGGFRCAFQQRLDAEEGCLHFARAGTWDLGQVQGTRCNGLLTF